MRSLAAGCQPPVVKRGAGRALSPEAFGDMAFDDLPCHGEAGVAGRHHEPPVGSVGGRSVIEVTLP
jgi:hypothetical protein